MVIQRVREVLALYGERIGCAGDIVTKAAWCFGDSTRLRYEESSFREYLCDEGNLEVLTAFMDVVPFEVRLQERTWEDSMREFCQDEEVSMRRLSRLVRIARTGQEAGPSLFACLEFLGPVETEKRVEFAIILGSAVKDWGAEFHDEKMWLAT